MMLFNNAIICTMLIADETTCPYLYHQKYEFQLAPEHTWWTCWPAAADPAWKLLADIRGTLQQNNNALIFVTSKLLLEVSTRCLMTRLFTICYTWYSARMWWCSSFQTHKSCLLPTYALQSATSSSRMHVMNHNWSATKQRLHPQSVAEISRHSVLSGDRIWQCGTASGSRHKDTDL